MSVACISDIHGVELHKEFMPKADILVIAGDATKRGCHREFLDFAKNMETWSGNYGHIVYTPGKHDTALEHYPDRYIDMLCDKNTNLNVLINSDIVLCDLHIWGTPYSKYDPLWSFTERDNQRKYLTSHIAPNTDVLVSYSPPLGLLDIEKYSNSGNYCNVGCQFLLHALKTLQPKLHAFGKSHVNYGVGYYNKKKTIYANGSLMCDYTSPWNPVRVFQIKPK